MADFATAISLSALAALASTGVSSEPNQTELRPGEDATTCAPLFCGAAELFDREDALSDGRADNHSGLHDYARGYLSDPVTRLDLGVEVRNDIQMVGVATVYEFTSGESSGAGFNGFGTNLRLEFGDL